MPFLQIITGRYLNINPRVGNIDTTSCTQLCTPAKRLYPLPPPSPPSSVLSPRLYLRTHNSSTTVKNYLQDKRTLFVTVCLRWRSCCNMKYYEHIMVFCNWRGIKSTRNEKTFTPGAGLSWQRIKMELCKYSLSCFGKSANRGNLRVYTLARTDTRTHPKSGLMQLHIGVFTHSFPENNIEGGRQF